MDKDKIVYTLRRLANEHRVDANALLAAAYVVEHSQKSCSTCCFLKGRVCKRDGRWAVDACKYWSLNDNLW